MNAVVARELSTGFVRRLLMLGLVILSSGSAFAPPATVEGSAFDGATRVPIPGATISLCEQPGGKAIGRCVDTSTDPEGRFAFADRPAGRYYLKGKAMGYLEDYLVLDGRDSGEFSLGNGDARLVRLRLWPEAFITGRVVDETGRAMPGVAIAAIREDYTFGQRHLARYQYRAGPSEMVTDERGEFRIGELKPGKYYLEAFFQASKEVGDSVLSKGYVPLYYPGTPFLAAAAALCVGAGEQHRADFRLLPRQTLSARGKLVLPSDFKRKFDPLISLTNEYGELVHHWTEEYDQHSKSFVLGRLAPGSYQVEYATGIYAADPVARYRFTITDTDADGLTVPMQIPVTLRAAVHLPPGFRPTNSSSVRLRLQLDGLPLDGSGWPVSKDGEIVFPALKFGHYTVHLFTEDAVYLKSALFGHQDVVAKGFSINNAPTEVLDVTLARANTEIRGTVVAVAGAPVSEADVKLIAQGDDSRYVVKSVNTDRQGAFFFADVAPGIYDVVALDRAVRDSEFGAYEFALVKRWTTRVEVGDADRVRIELNLAPFVYAPSKCSVAALP